MRKLLIPLMGILILTTACGSKKGSSSTTQASTSELRSLESEINELFAVAESTSSITSPNCNQTVKTYDFLLHSDNTQGSVQYTQEISKTGDDCGISNNNEVKVFEGESNSICLKNATTNGNIVNFTNCDGIAFVYDKKAQTLQFSSKQDNETYSRTIKSIAIDTKSLDKKLKNITINYFKKTKNESEEKETFTQYKTITGNAVEILKLRL